MFSDKVHMVFITLLITVTSFFLISCICFVEGGREASLRPAKITSVICALMVLEEQYVDEWILYHKYLGFDHIHITDNSKIPTHKMQSLPQAYDGFVTISHDPGEQVQRKSYGACHQRYTRPGLWISYLDCDEFIVLRKHNTINDFIRDMARLGSAVSLHRAIFGSNHQKHKLNLPVLMRFTRRAIQLDKMIKTIAHSVDTVKPFVHGVKMKSGKRRVNTHGLDITDLVSDSPNNITEDIAVIYHYRVKSEEEFLVRKARGDAVFKSKALEYASNKTHILELMESLDRDSNQIVDKTAWDFFSSHFLEVV